jgi:hypothetical protein
MNSIDEELIEEAKENNLPEVRRLLSVGGSEDSESMFDTETIHACHVVGFIQTSPPAFVQVVRVTKPPLAIGHGDGRSEDTLALWSLKIFVTDMYESEWHRFSRTDPSLKVAQSPFASSLHC